VETRIRPEQPDDREAVRRVHRLAFGREEEAGLVDALRGGGYARVSLVAEADGDLVGHILFSDLRIETAGGPLPALALAPLAVVPARQGRGIGSALARAGLAAAAAAGHRIAIVLGHPTYYPRFGFSAALAVPLAAPFSGDAFMACELVPGALNGVAGRVVYPPPFGDL
jgi:putative acetyltransferase